MEGYPRAPREGAGGVSQSHRLHHPPHGRHVRQLLHQGGDGDFDTRVCLCGRGDEEDHPEGCEAVRRHGRRRARVHPHRGDARIFQKLLGQAHGAGPQELQPAGGDHAGDCAEGWRQRDHRAGRGGPQGRVRALQAHGDGDDHEGYREVGHRRRGREARGASHRRHPLRVPGADGGRRRRHAQWLWHRGDVAGQEVQALPAPDLRHDQVEAQQQERGGAAASGGSHRQDCQRYENLRGGAAHGPPRRRALRVFGRGVPRGFGFHPGCAEGDRERHGDVADDAAGEGLAPEAHPDSQEQAREGSGELHRPRGSHRGQGRGVRPGARVDAHLLRAPRDAQGDQEGYPPSNREHLRLHRESNRPPRRPRHLAQQPQGSGTPEPRVHHSRHRHRRRDVLPLHRVTRADERVQSSRAQHPKRRPQVPRVSLRVHRRDGQRLRLRGDAATGRCAHGPRLGAQADGGGHGQASRAGVRGVRVRGCADAPDELRLPQRVRDVAALDQRRDGSLGGRPDVPRAGFRVGVPAAGSVPPRAEGSGDLLEDLQHPLHRRAGCAGISIPGVGG